MTLKTIKKKTVKYPFIHPKGRISYVPGDNQYMLLARKMSKQFRSNLALPGAAIIVKDGRIIGQGSIGNNSAHINGCVRVKLNMPTGQGYELCEGCHPANHSEASAIRNALEAGHDTTGAELYLWGHWWCCADCWQAMIENGITQVYLLKDSEVLFNQAAPKNIVGKQFAKNTI